MFDKFLVLSILKQIDEALEKIKSRTSHIQSANDFTDSPSGMEKLDGICEPVEFFGGEAALQKQKQLDKRKAQLCRENGLRLIYVTPDDEVSVDAVEKILARGETGHKGRAPKSTTGGTDVHPKSDN